MASGSDVQRDNNNGLVALKSPLVEFLGCTTAHGLGRLSSQTRLFGKIIWIIFLLGTYARFIFHLYTLLDRFYSGPVLTSFTASIPFEFPDVYICPAQAVTMSRVIGEIKSSRLQNIPTNMCDTKCQIEEFKFDVNKREYMPGETVLNKQSLALSSVMTSIEESLVHEFRVGAYRNGSECRITQSGEEYSGNVSRAPVYSSSALVMPNPRPDDYSATHPPVVTYKPCLAWNDAARKLKSSGVVDLADRVFQLNYSDGDARCRSPPGLPLSELAAVGLPPAPRPVACFPATNDDIDAKMKFYCMMFGTSATTENCAECCSSGHFVYAVLFKRSCYCTNDYQNMNTSTIRTDCTSAGECSMLDDMRCGARAQVFQIRDIDPRPLTIRQGSKLTNIMEGPYCFYEDSAGLSASYCEIPFCQMPEELDCAPRLEGSKKQKRSLQQYTGFKNVSNSGKQCLPWNKLHELVVPKYASDDTKVLAVHIDTPDMLQDVVVDHNYCRTASVQVGHAYLVFDESGRKVVSMSPLARVVLASPDVPGCFTKNAVHGVSFEPCDVSLCDDIASVNDIISDTIGSNLLARQFSNDLHIGMADCSFAGQRCTEKDFANIIHPELGTCHKFLKDHFVQGMTSTELASSQLAIKYFTDSTDSQGRRLANISRISRVVHSTVTDDYANTALRAIVVPPGAFPWSSEMFDVAAAQRMNVELKYEKFHRLSSAVRPCVESVQPITYRLQYWSHDKPVTDADLLEEDSWATMSEKNWRRKIDLLRASIIDQSKPGDLVVSDVKFQFSGREDCINKNKVQKFADKCSCVPPFLPIPDAFIRLPFCLNETDTAILYERQKCFREQVLMLKKYHADSLMKCQPACQSSGYSLRYVSNPWPKLNEDTSLDFLKSLAKGYGYKHNISTTKGIASIYYVYLRVFNYSENNRGNEDLLELLELEKELDTLEDRLAQLIIKAWTPYGQEVVEEDAYPLKNLMADVGGALGLWSGISILTVCEVLELLLYLAAVLVKPNATATADKKRPGGDRDSGSARATNGANPEQEEMIRNADEAV